jgi:hypothetical protein
MRKHVIIAAVMLAVAGIDWATALERVPTRLGQMASMSAPPAPFYRSAISTRPGKGRGPHVRDSPLRAAWLRTDA